MIYTFAGCELDEARRTLVRNDEEQAVQPKVLDLLLFLAKHRARMVPKDVLSRELWPDAIVTEASLTRLVKEARKVVGDDGRRQHVIKTAHRRGYRFVAEVTLSNGTARSEEDEAIDLARRSLEAAIEFGALDLRERVREFAETCHVAIESARGATPTGAV